MPHVGYHVTHCAHDTETKEDTTRPHSPYQLILSPHMGIDIYARWNGQSAQEIDAQCTGFSVVHGHVGYLREAYHGEPYATHYLVREAFEAPEHTSAIAAAVLRERLPHTLALVEQRQREVYREADPMETQRVKQSFVDFVELCERQERKTGKPVTIIAGY